MLVKGTFSSMRRHPFSLNRYYGHRHVLLHNMYLELLKRLIYVYKTVLEAKEEYCIHRCNFSLNFEFSCSSCPLLRVAVRRGSSFVYKK